MDVEKAIEIHVIPTLIPDDLELPQRRAADQHVNEAVDVAAINEPVVIGIPADAVCLRRHFRSIIRLQERVVDIKPIPVFKTAHLEPGPSRHNLTVQAIGNRVSSALGQDAVIFCIRSLIHAELHAHRFAFRIEALRVDIRG